MKRLVILFLFTLSMFSPGQLAAEGKAVYSVTLSDDIISPVTSGYIISGIEKAEKDGAAALIIQIDTPGGLLASTREIVMRIMSADVPVIAYVAPSGARAGSAGVFITEASHIAAMAPSTNIGAAHPVSIGERRSFDDILEQLTGKLPEGKGKKKPKREPMEEKILNDTKAWIEGIAKMRGRNAEWAVRSVAESASITADAALRERVIDLVAKDKAELLDKVNGRILKLKEETVALNTKGAAIVELPKSFKHRLLAVVANPNIAYILLMLGFYGLLFEFTHPGVAFPGIAGAICLIASFYGLHVLSANYAGIALIILAIVLFIMEVKVVSYGLLTLGGVVSLFLGSLMLFDSPWEAMQVSMPLILSFTLATAAIATFLITIVLKAHRRRTMTGLEGLVGGAAEVVRWSGNAGKVFIHGETWNAEGEAGLAMGDKVMVSGVRGMVLVVKK